MNKVKSRLKSVRRKQLRRKIVFTIFLLLLALYIISKIETLNPVRALAPSQFDVVYVEKQVEVIKEVEVDRTFDGEKANIQAMIIQEFGGDIAPLAIAVAKAESGFDPTRENRGKANPGYRGECSIGVFQINLRSDGCNGAKVHWDIVPGNTLEEKVSWLKVPENNIKLAHKLYKSYGNNFNKWGAYSSGAYKNL